MLMRNLPKAEKANCDDLFPLDILLLAGDIELNPGPQTENSVRFFHWNLNGICARNGVKIPLIEAYNSLYKYDVITVSQSMLDSKVRDEEISIEGFSKEVFRNDHPSDSKSGVSACIFERVCQFDVGRILNYYRK